MSNWRTICRPHHAVVTSSLIGGCSGGASCSSYGATVRPGARVSVGFGFRCLPPPLFSPHPRFRFDQRRTTAVRASNWTDQKSPYDTLELERDADEEQIKVAYRRLAKYYHPDVYDGRGTLEEGESAESRFIKIQAAYELLMDEDKRKQYDVDNRVNPMKASKSWMEWVMNKRKAFDQRGDQAIATWAEQQQREMRLRARRLARSKIDPEEERRIFAREQKASAEYYNVTLRRHALVLKKRDLMRKKAEQDKKSLVSQMLAEEGLELESEDDIQ